MSESVTVSENRRERRRREPMDPQLKMRLLGMGLGILYSLSICALAIGLIWTIYNATNGISLLKSLIMLIGGGILLGGIIGYNN